MFHLFGYYGNQQGVTGYDALPIQDDILTIQNNHFLPQQDMKLFAAYIGGNLMNYAQLVTPSLRQISIPRLIPVSGTILPPTDPNLIDLRLNPLILKGVEEVSILNTVNANAGALPFVNLFAAGAQLDSVPFGDILTLHGTSTTAAVSLAWTSLQITYDTSLPAGNYAVIGAQVISTNALAHRFIFKNQFWRPGFLSQNAVASRTGWDYYRGGMGMLGEFTTTTYPTLQVLVNGTDASHDVTLFIVKRS